MDSFCCALGVHRICIYIYICNIGVFVGIAVSCLQAQSLSAAEK